METISVAEFHNRVVSFREKMGTVLEGDQYRNLFKMLSLSYLNVDQNDPYYSESVADLFDTTTQEYMQRMILMGHGV